jgi:hypothetical protein
MREKVMVEDTIKIKMTPAKADDNNPKKEDMKDAE